MTVTDTTYSTTEAAQEARGRAWLYGLFGRLFDDVPDADVIGQLVNGDAARLASVALEIGVSEPAVARIGSISEADIESLSVEFTTLFEAHGRIYPFASCWTGEKPRLMRKPWALANEAYKRVGLGLTEERLPRADHIGTELGFLSVLAVREAEADSADALSAASAEFDSFMSVNVMTWMLAFCEQVQADVRADYYAALAEVLGAVLASEKQVDVEESLVVSMDTSKEVEL